jgi:hypothetical protein
MPQQLQAQQVVEHLAVADLVEVPLGVALEVIQAVQGGMKNGEVL